MILWGPYLFIPPQCINRFHYDIFIDIYHCTLLISSDPGSLPTPFLLSMIPCLPYTSLPAGANTNAALHLSFFLAPWQPVVLICSSNLILCFSTSSVFSVDKHRSSYYPPPPHTHKKAKKPKTKLFPSFFSRHLFIYLAQGL